MARFTAGPFVSAQKIKLHLHDQTILPSLRRKRCLPGYAQRSRQVPVQKL